MFCCSRKFSTGTTQKVVFHLLSIRIFHKRFLNDKQPVSPAVRLGHVSKTSWEDVVHYMWHCKRLLSFLPILARTMKVYSVQRHKIAFERGIDITSFSKVWVNYNQWLSRYSPKQHRMILERSVGPRPFFVHQLVSFCCLYSEARIRSLTRRDHRDILRVTRWVLTNLSIKFTYPSILFLSLNKPNYDINGERARYVAKNSFEKQF